jgi:D-aspartate ligase
MCEKYGMSYPKTLTCNKKNYNKIKIDFKYPIIVKPNNSVMYWNCRFENKKKVFILNSYEEYLEATTAVYGSSYTDDLVIQEFIPGDDSKMRVVNAYCNQEGKVKMISLGKVLLEEYTPEGIGSYAAIISGYDKKIYDMIINFLEKINYKGYANFDMKFDTRDNEYKLFELNPRQGRSSYFVSAGGVNLIKPLVDDVIYNKDPKIVYGKDEALYTIIPKGVILKYTSDKELKEKAKKLYKEKKYSDGYYFDGDTNLKRKMAFKANQLNYFKKYAKYYKEKK